MESASSADEHAVRGTARTRGDGLMLLLGALTLIGKQLDLVGVLLEHAAQEASLLLPGATLAFVVSAQASFAARASVSISRSSSTSRIDAEPSRSDASR